jgi:hypothetical protein
MRKILLLSTILALASCGPNANDVTIEEIKSEKEVQISKEKTEQLKLQLKIEKEKNK